MNNKFCYLSFNRPKENKDKSTLNENIQVYSLFENKLLGTIEVIGTSVQHQLAIVFSKGGGQATEIDFGTVYYGQTKEISAYLVNNGPNKINYKFFFHPDKDPSQINENDSDFTCTPYEAGIEMSQRILSSSPIDGLVNPYDQVSFYSIYYIILDSNKI